VSKKIILISAVLLVGALLAYLIQDFVRQALLYPLVYLYWSLRLIYEGVPGAVWWGICLALLLLLALSSLSREKEPSAAGAETNGQSPSRPQAWMRWMAKNKQGDYFKWQLAREISTLALTGIANRDRLTPADARAELIAGRLNLPVHIQAYLLAGSLPSSYSQYIEMKPKLIKPGIGSPLELDPEEIVAFLESEFER
jgi:hypothetical protein